MQICQIHESAGASIVLGLVLCTGCNYDQGLPRADEGETDGSGDVVEIPGGETDGGGAETGSSGGQDEDPADPGDCQQETDWALAFLETNCGACHAQGSPGQGNFDYVTDLNQLLASGKIVGGDPGASPVFVKMDAQVMPPPGIEPRPEPKQIERFGEFIASCVDAPQGQCQNNPPLSMAEQLQVIQDDITTVDVDDRPFTRYLSLAHLHNAGFCDEDLEVYRFAMAKLVNSLSSETKVVAPWPIDASETLYRIDLRDYGWDEPTGFFSDKWEALIDASPYAVERLEDEAETIKELARTDVPILMADAFIDVAAQPPLYHELADIPATLSQLESQLGIDVAANIEDEEVARAGILDSGVSKQNRIIERHEIPLAANRVFWLSYDFADDSQAEQNIYASPLDFQEAGGEVIFSLPNGLHAYMLVDAVGNRLDEAPDDIVTDPAQEDQNVRNGISCFGCHPTILPAQDSVRDYVLAGVEFDAQTKDIVESIYPEVPEFQALQETDTETLHWAIDQAGVDPSLAIEPVSDVFARFQLNVDIEIAAAELGISPATLQTQLGGLEPALSPLVDSSIKRDTWTSLYANTICRLNLGIADDPECGFEN